MVKNEKEKAAVEPDEFIRGYVLACCNLQNLHDEPTMIADALRETPITQADIDALNLSEYDLMTLKEIRESSGPECDPIIKKK